jgi:pimeloyl-ACP methyl ester carboxylesterase
VGLIPRRATNMPRLELSNAVMEFDDAGAGAPILLLHGFPATRRLWSQVIPLLVARGIRAIAPDLVGYGSSAPGPGVRIDMASQARWMWQLLDVLEIERTFLVAHDVGSAVAQLMVAASPARVRGLVILDGVYETEWAMDAIESIRDWDTAEAHRLFPVLLRRLGKSQHLREMLAAYAGDVGGKRLIQAARDLEPDQTAAVGQALRASRVRSLVLWGRDDRYLDLDTVARPLAGLLSAPLAILSGGHFTPSDCPREVSDAVCDFVAASAAE